MLEKVIELTNDYIDTMPKKERKKYGQFFTSMETARFMANLYDITSDMTKISVLDAGAGSGILACAFLERVERLPFVEEIEVTCYENDEKILQLLENNLKYCQQKSTKKISFSIVKENYILSQYLDFNCMIGGNPNPKKYDFVIGNPPYMKIPKTHQKLQLCRKFVMEHLIFILYLRLWDSLICVMKGKWYISYHVHGHQVLILGDLENIF